MGTSFEVYCLSCDYNKNFQIGIGMMYSPYNLLDFSSELALLPRLIHSEKKITHIKELVIGKNAQIADEYGHEVYRCIKCGEFYERFYLSLEYDGGSYKISYECPKCEVELERISYNNNEDDDLEVKSINFDKYPCPKCGKHSLYEGELTMLWD